jgi:flagellin-like protein
VHTELLATGKRKVGKTKETAETMNAITGIFSVIIMIVIVLCGMTAWLIFRKLKYDHSVFMDMHDQETRKTTE